MAGKNLLVNGKNNITARANAMADIQNTMANRTTASNVNTTPNLPTPTRPTTINLQKAQTPINTKLNNLNNATMPTGTITTNNPAFVNGQLTNQNTPSRFIGFQKPKTDLGGNLTQEGIKSLQPKGQNFNDLLKPTLYIPTETKNVAKETAKNSKEYKANEDLIKKFHYAVKNANGQLTADDIKKQFKEWNKNVDAALQLQADIRPLVQQGQFADMNQISEFYSELLPKQKQADTTKLKEQEEMNKNLTELSAKADKILSRYNTLSNNGVKVLEDYKQLSEYADYLKKNYRLVGDNITDADIINFAKESIPEVKQLVNEIQQLEMNFNLTEEDRNVLYENGFDIGDWLLQAGADIQNFTQNNQLANYLSNNSAKRSSQLKDLGFNASSANTLGNLPSKALSIGSIPVNMVGELAGGVGQVDTALERIAKQQNRNEDGTIDTNGVIKDAVMGGGGAMTVGWNTVMAIPTAIYNLANETEVGAALTDTTIGNADRGLDKLLSGEKLKGIGLDDNAIAEWYNNQDEQTQAEARKILLTAIFHKGSKGIGKLKKLGNFEMNAVSEALNDLSKQKVSIETNSPTFKAKVEQGLADGLMKISDDGILTDKNGNNIGKVKVKKMTTGEKTRYVVDRIISINRAAWNARSLGELNPNALPDNRTIKEKAQSQINQAKENITEGIEGVKEGVNNIVDTTKQGIKKAKNVANRIEIAPGKVGEVFDNMKNKVTSKKPTSQKSEMQEQQQGLKEQSLEQEQAGQNNGEIKITNDTQKIGKSKTGGTLSEKVYDKLTGLDEATRERMKANPYSAEENKNLIDTMESDTAFDFNEYQTNRYQNVLDTIVDKLEQKENTRKNEVGPLYQKLEETNAPIDTTNIKNQSTKFRDKVAENDGIISSSEQTKINKLLDAIDSLGDGTTDIWKIRRMADQWAKWDTESTTDGIRLIREIRDAIDDEIRVQRPEMKEVDTEYRRIKDEIADLRGNLINKKSGKLRDNAVSTVKNLLNPSNKQFLDRLEKEIPGITKQLQAIRDSKFVYNAYQTGNGSRFISGIARGTLGNMFKAVGVVTGGIPGLLFGALLDKAVDTALVSLTRKALKATITEMTPKAQAELESIMKKVQEGKELTAKEKAKLKEIENKIVENAENAKKTKAEQEAWDNFLNKVKKDAKSLKLPNKGGTDGGKNILTNGKTIITDAKGNSKVKGQISEIDNRVKKSDSSSSDDTTPPTGGTPTGGTPTGTNPTNNQGGTPATDDTKNAVTKKQPKKKAEAKKTEATTKQENKQTRKPREDQTRTELLYGDLEELGAKVEDTDGNLTPIADVADKFTDYVHRVGMEKSKGEYDARNIAKAIKEYFDNHKIDDFYKKEVLRDDGVYRVEISDEALTDILNRTIELETGTKGDKKVRQITGKVTQGIIEEERKNKVTAKKTEATAPKQETKPQDSGRITAPKKERQIIKNDKGENEIVYHGTNAKFDKFDKNFIGRGGGFRFTTSKGEAETYGKNVKKYNLMASNILDADADNWTDLADSLIKQYTREKFGKEFYISPEAFIQDEGLRNYVQELGYDALKFSKGGDTKYIVYNEDQIIPVQKQPKTKATETAKNKVTNPSKAKTTSLFNENEVDKGNKSEGLNPDALPLSDYREMQRLNGDGLDSSLRRQDELGYISTKIANEKVGIKPDWDDNEAWDKLPEDFEDDWETVASDIEDMYNAYEEGDIETANKIANRQFPGKTAKEVIDQYKPQYEADLKIYNRLNEKYPGVFSNGKIDLTGAEGRSRREFASQENETAQDIDYQELAEMENQTPQDIDYQDLAELENETPQMLEEESTNKVTSNSKNKVTNGGTNLDKAIEIIKNADATKPQQGYIGEDTYARVSSSDVVIKTKGDSDFNQVSFYRKAVSLSEMAQNDTMFIVLNDVGEKGIENVNKVLEGFDLQYRVGSELDNRGDTVYYLENTNTGHKDYFSDEGRSEPALSKTLRDKTVVPRLTPEQQAEYDKQMEQRRKEQEAEREKERQEEEKRKEEEAKRLEEENTRKANLLTYVNDTYGDNPLQRGRVLKELSELNEESDHKIRYYGDEVPDNAEVWQVLDALADLNGSFSETRESGDNYTWTYNYGDNRSINRLTKAQKNYLEYRMNIKPVQNRLQNYLDNIENKSLRTRTENVLNKKDRWKLDDGKIVTWTKAQYIEWLVNDLGYRPKEFPTGKTYANGEPKIDYMIVNEKNAGYISSKIENGYAKSLLETPEEELSAEDEAKLDKELFNKKSDNSDYESRIIKDNSNYKFEDLKDADIETILSKDGFEKYTFEEDGQKGEGYAGYINGKAVDIIPNKEKNRITINVGDELFRSYDDGSINVQLNGSDEITQTSSVYDNETFKGTLARALGTEYKALGEPKSYKYDKDNGVFAIYDKSDSDKILYEVSLGDKVMFDDGTIYDTSKHLGAGRTQGGEKHFDNKPVTEIFAGKTLIGISKGNKYASNKYTDTRAQGAVLKDMESIQELEWLLEDKNNILVGEIEGTPVKVSALDLNYNPIKMENVGKEDDYYNKVKTYKLQVGKNTDNTYFYDTFPELKSALKRIYVGEDVNKTTTEVTGEKNAVTAKLVENEKPKNLVTSRIENTKQEIQEIDKDTYFDDIVKNLKDHPREMFIYKDGNYFYPHYILPSGKVITPENTYWGEVSSEEAARNWLLKEAEEHSEENETKKAEKLKEIVGKTADKYEATLKRIESDNPMQEIWTSGDYFKYGMGNNQMARAKKESEANAEVGTFKKDVIDGKEGYRIFVAGTKNEAIRAFYEPKTGKTYRIYRGPIIDDSKPYTTKQVERIEKFLQNVDKQLDKETKKEKKEEKQVITQEWLDSLKPDKDGIIELDYKGDERWALGKGKEALIKEGKADGKYLYNYGGAAHPQYMALYIKNGIVYEGRKGLEDQYMTTKQEAVDWLNQKEKDVEHEGTERYTQTDYETLPKTISVESEAEKAGPKRIAPDRVKRQQETYDQGLESVKNVLKQSPVKIYELGFKSDRSKAVQNILEERKRIRQLPESEAEKQWNELAKSVYEDLVIKDISKGYRYPEDVTNKFPKAQMKKAVDARARYEKGLFTSFSAKDTRANNQYRDEIGAGIKSQDGKPVTQEQMNEIVDGIRAYSNIFGVDMKKFAEDNNVIYVHLHGGNPFLMGGMSIAGLYRRDAAGNISVSLGGREGVMEKGEDGKMKKSDIKTTTVHEITHAVDGMLEGKLFSDADTEILKKTMNKPSELINYYNRKQEIVARAVEQYAAHQLGKKLYRTALADIDWENGSVEFVEKEANYVDREAYWNQENFDKYVKPIVEKNMKEKMKDYMLENTRKNVLANDKNKITSGKTQAAKSYSPTIVMRLDENGNPIKKKTKNLVGNGKNKVTTNAEAIYNPVIRASGDPTVQIGNAKIKQSTKVKAEMYIQQYHPDTPGADILEQIDYLNSKVWGKRRKGTTRTREDNIGYRIKDDIILNDVYENGYVVIDNGEDNTGYTTISSTGKLIEWHVGHRVYNILKSKLLLR